MAAEKPSAMSAAAAAAAGQPGNQPGGGRDDGLGGQDPAAVRLVQAGVGGGLEPELPARG
jgi:hypothetical protein